MTFSPSNSQTAYLPPEQDFPEDSKQFREILAQRERLTATVVNIKENAQYEKRELLTGKQYFSQQVGGAIKTSYVYRITCDLVALNGGPIGAGVTAINLSATTQPPLIVFANSLTPVCGYGACTNATRFIFINSPTVFFETNIMTPASQIIYITNNSGSDLTQAWWVFEYVKN
jgi:hypothetical protein